MCENEQGKQTFLYSQTGQVHIEMSEFIMSIIEELLNYLVRYNLKDMLILIQENKLHEIIIFSFHLQMRRSRLQLGKILYIRLVRMGVIFVFFIRGAL